jgi:hypothetical protein
MKWFTREWADCALDDDELERRRVDYQRHLESIGADLDGGAEQLLSVYLHDAQVRVCNLDEDATLRLRALTGDLQRGYEWLSLQYHRAGIVGATIEDLSGRITEHGTELLYDEVDVCNDGRYEHRILMWPDGEFGVRFASLTVTREPALPSDRR